MTNHEIHAQFMASVSPAIVKAVTDSVSARDHYLMMEMGTNVDARIARNCREVADAMLESYLDRWPELKEPVRMSFDPPSISMTTQDV